MCFNGKAYYSNDPKSGPGSLGSETRLFEFAEEMISVLRERFSELISEQVLRVDFWRHYETDTFFLNEVEGKTSYIYNLVSTNSNKYFNKS